VLAAISIEGLLKTAAAVALAFPLLVLAIPILDTSFVVAKRIKHGKPIYSADRFHLHHRFLDRGFSQRQAVLTMYLWCSTLAGAALATRFLAPHAHGHWQLWQTLADGVSDSRYWRPRPTSSTSSRSSRSRARAAGIEGGRWSGNAAQPETRAARAEVRCRGRIAAPERVFALRLSVRTRDEL